LSEVRSTVADGPFVCNGCPAENCAIFIDESNPYRSVGRRKSSAAALQAPFGSLMEVFVWLAKVLRWGNFRRVAKPLYSRLAHPIA
jgi:hypothetical protein